MSCRRMRNSLVQYADNELEGARADEVRAHLESCERCRSAARKLHLSREAISSLDGLSVPEDSVGRIFDAVKARLGAKPSVRERLADRLGFLNTPRGAHAAGVALAVLIVLSVAVFAYIGPGNETDPAPGTKDVARESETTVPASFGEEPKPDTDAQAPALAATIMPVVKVSETNYDQDSLKASFEEMEIRRRIAQEYNMSHCIQYGRMYREKVADMMVDAGQDGAMLDAMMTFVTNSEPVLLPYYAEHCRYTGQEVFVMGFAGPKRTASSNKLTRTEVWVLSPEKFPAGPDSSIVYFLEHKME